MSMDDDFRLTNDPEPPAKPAKVVPVEPKAKQMVLFCGLDCLPGQQDLFDTDGRE